MTNNIFVPQTFNGERMVNVNLPNRRVGTQPINEGSTTPTTITTPTSTTATVPSTTTTTTTTTVVPTRLRIAPSGETTSPKNLKPQVSPPPINNAATTIPLPPSSPTNNNKNLQKYWSEANIAILIQLHRRYFNNTEQNIETWSPLTKEYNTITGDGRPKQAVIKRWSKVMRKYNAERSYLIQQKSTQQMPLVSYWNHFQYLDSYLSHLPIPDDSLYIKNPLEDEYEDYDQTIIVDKKRKFDQVEPINEKIKLLETMLEQTMDRQELQINSIKTHYDDMNKMNMKFVDMCEKITLRNQSNESRYLDLLEKYITKSSLNKN